MGVTRLGQTLLNALNHVGLEQRQDIALAQILNLNSMDGIV